MEIINYKDKDILILDYNVMVDFEVNPLFYEQIKFDPDAILPNNTYHSNIRMQFLESDLINQNIDPCILQHLDKHILLWENEQYELLYLKSFNINPLDDNIIYYCEYEFEKGVFINKKAFSRWRKINFLLNKTI